jgi:hypothetical protein
LVELFKIFDSSKKEKKGKSRKKKNKTKEAMLPKLFWSFVGLFLFKLCGIVQNLGPF